MFENFRCCWQSNGPFYLAKLVSAGSLRTPKFLASNNVWKTTDFLLRNKSILYGVSMGAVAILRAEAELGVRPSANILECPYGNMRQTAYNRFESMHGPAFPMADLLVF